MFFIFAFSFSHLCAAVFRWCGFKAAAECTVKTAYIGKTAVKCNVGQAAVGGGNHCQCPFHTEKHQIIAEILPRCLLEKMAEIVGGIPAVCRNLLK